MADNNTYTSKQNIKKYTTQAKFDAIDKSDVPVGTEYNIVGSITESDLDSDLQAKVNESVTGDGLTTEVTDGKVKVKNPMTFEGQRGVELNSTNLGSAYSTGTTYVFPNSTPLGQDYVNGHFPIGIVPIIGATDSYIIDNTSATTTYQGIFLPNAYDSNNYDVNAYAMITMTRSNNSGNQIYILPYCGSNPGVSYLLNQESIQAGSGSNMSIYRDNEGKVWLSAEAPSSADIPNPPSSAGTEAVLTSYAAQSGATEIVWKTPEDTDIFANVLVKTIDRFGLYMTDPKTLSKRTIAAFDWDAKDQGSGVSRYILMTPDMPNLSGFETGGTITHTLPDKSGTLATTDDIVTAYKTITLADLNSPSMLEEVKSGFYYIEANSSNTTVTDARSSNIARAPQPSLINPILPTGQYYVIVNNDCSRSSGDGYHVMAFAQNVDTQELYNICFDAAGSSGWKKIATMDDIPTGGTTYTAGKNIEISGTTIAVADNLTRLYSLEIKPSNDAPTASLIVLNTNGGSIIDVNFVDKNTRILPNTDTTTGYEAIRLPSGSGTLVTDASFKTLFGNQNIVGSGNIDLYQHIITILLNDGTKTAAIIVSKISSSNLQVDSLTDLKTLFGATFTYPCSGAVYNTDGSGNATAAVTISDVDVRYISGGTIASFSYASATTMQFVDQVKTV